MERDHYEKKSTYISLAESRPVEVAANHSFESPRVARDAQIIAKLELQLQTLRKKDPLLVENLELIQVRPE